MPLTAGTREKEGITMTIDTSKGNPAMNYREHEKTYAGFVQASKYIALGIVALLVLMAIFLL
jgi:hypothetical protein